MMTTTKTDTDTKTAAEVIKTVRNRADEIKNDSTQDFPEAASIGDYVRQGDIYINKVSGIPHQAELVEDPDTQLAEGNTKGSRHCLASLEGVKVYQDMMPVNAFVGPYLKLEHPNTVTHPEHGDWKLPAGCYLVTYQRDLDAEERERRVID